MAELGGGGDGGHGKKGKKRAKRSSTKIDMTPMVDLAFLLLTFFVLTATFNKPNAMKVTLPEKPKTEAPDPPEVKDAVHLLLAKDNKMYWYGGMPADFKANNRPVLTPIAYGVDGIRKLLLSKNAAIYNKSRELQQKFEKGELGDGEAGKDKLKEAKINLKKELGKEVPPVLIKATNDAVYENLVDILDEMNICEIPRYNISTISGDEVILLEEQGAK